MIHKETSYGVIPLKKRGKEWLVLLINHKKGGYWAFPKGHGEIGETPFKTAGRELFEETGLSVYRILYEGTLQEAYTFYRGKKQIHKEVHYFLAEVSGTINLQVEEVYDSKWVKLSEAGKHITFEQARGLALQAQKLLESMKDEG